MRQKKISYWLKGIVILLGLMGIAFFGGLTAYAVYLKETTEAGRLWTFIVFSWYTAALCYGVLIEFWKVCSQIGNDNSFSLENAVYFHRMSLYGTAGAVGFIARLCWLAVNGVLQIPMAIFIAGEILLSVVFVVLCEALSKLIQNAYEMKQENDLTI